jgi:hypothetical protein
MTQLDPSKPTPPLVDDRPDPGKTITAAEARRAIYIDFEDRKDEAPALIGWLHAEGRATTKRLVFRHDIFDPVLQRMVGHHVGLEDVASVDRYEDRVCTLARSIEDVVRRAEAKDRLIVSWSRHELRSCVRPVSWAGELSHSTRTVG